MGTSPKYLQTFTYLFWELLLLSYGGMTSISFLGGWLFPFGIDVFSDGIWGVL